MVQAFCALLLRNRIRTICIICILTILSAGMLTQIEELTALKKLYVNLLSQYHAYGFVEKERALDSYPGFYYYFLEDPRVKASIGTIDCSYTAISKEEISQIVSLKTVDGYDWRVMTAGLSDYLRLQEESGYPYTSRLVLEGTLESVAFNAMDDELNQIIFSNVRILAGETNLVDGGTATIYGYNGQSPFFSIANSPTKAAFCTAENYIYGTAFQKEMRPGDRYVLVCKQNTPGGTIYLYDLLTEDWCPSVWDITGKTTEYLSLEEFTTLQELIDITEKDNHTLDVVYTECMESIRAMSDGSMILLDGRLLTEEDTGQPVCVVGTELADRYHLSVGDSLELKLGNALFEQFYAIGAVSLHPARLATSYEDVSLTVVGIVSDATSASKIKNPHGSYSVNTVFVPSTLLPTSVHPEENPLSPGEFSFIVNPEDINAFWQEDAQKIEAMGLSLTFEDYGFLSLSEALDQAASAIRLRLGFLVFLMLITIGLVVFLWMRSNRQIYVTMRCLGTKQRNAEMTIGAPLVILTCFSELMAGILFLSLRSALVAQDKSLTSLSKDIESDLHISAVSMLCMLSVLLLEMLWMRWTFMRLRRRSLLSLSSSQK